MAEPTPDEVVAAIKYGNLTADKGRSEPFIAGLEGQTLDLVRAARALRHGVTTAPGTPEVERLVRELVTSVDAFDQAWEDHADQASRVTRPSCLAVDPPWMQSA